MRYTIEKYHKHKNIHITTHGDLLHGEVVFDQQMFAEHVKEHKISIIDIAFYPTNDFVVINFSFYNSTYIKSRALGPSITAPTSILECNKPQIWFLHFLYKNYPAAHNGIVFYVKNSRDVRERFTYMGINEELQIFAMTLMLSENDHET